jgi:hypothetical protein
LFAHMSATGRLKCGPSEFQGKHVVIPRSEQQIVTLDQT